MDINTEVEEWFDRYADDVYSFLSYYCGSLDVDDLVQETFLRAMVKMDLYKGNASPKTWLCSIARNVAKDSFRKHRSLPTVMETSALVQVPSSEMSPEGLTQFNEMKQDLHAVIGKLQPNYRDVVILRGILDLSVSEAASVLGWADGKVRTVYHRALKSLRRHLTGSLGEEFTNGYL